MQDQVHRNDVDTRAIRRLLPELLRLIFFENTHLGHHHDPLRTARSTSQVCRQWREILLSFSSLWGRLVFVDQLWFTNTDDPWRNEVLTRSGSALLWIHGHVTLADAGAFLSFLEQNWERIERVNVTEGDQNSFKFGRFVSRINPWKGLESRAPNLKSFALHYVGNTDPFLLPVPYTNHSLFKGGAPKLRELSIPDMKFNTRSPWLFNIRVITLSTIFSIQEVFQILKSTPLLTNLDITMKPVGGSSKSQPLERDQPCIILPFLETFSLQAYFHVALPFFECLEFPASCIPAFVLTDTSIWELAAWGNTTTTTALETDRTTMAIMRDKLVKRMQIHLPLRRMIHMTINIEQWETRLSFSGHDGVGVPTSLSVSLSGPFHGPPQLLEELSICDHLPSVKEMVLYVNVLTSKSSAYPARFPSFALSLTTLVTDERTLKFFLDIKSVEKECVPFPALEVLKLTHLGPSVVTDEHPSQTIWDFFQWQMTGPSPISVIDLSVVPSHELYDMEYLENVPRLKIVKFMLPRIGLSEYECGGGKPETLRFKQVQKSNLWRGSADRDIGNQSSLSIFK